MIRDGTATAAMLREARSGGGCVLGINVYDLHQAAAVLEACRERRRDVILQVSRAALGGLTGPVVEGLANLADSCETGVSLHLDHASEDDLAAVHSLPLSSVMFDGSRLALPDNIGATARVVAIAHPMGRAVEAEVGRLAGRIDDGVETVFGAPTEPDEAAEFVMATGVDALAVAVGNVHGAALANPVLDLARLESIARRCDIPLVLHGASGISAAALAAAISAGVAKVNVNTEIRRAYADGLGAPGDLVDRLRSGQDHAWRATMDVISRLEEATALAGLADRQSVKGGGR